MSTGLTGAAAANYLQKLTALQQAQISGLNNQLQQQSGKTPICGRLLSDEISVGGFGAIAINPSVVGYVELQGGLFPKPIVDSVTAQAEANLLGVLQDVYTQGRITNVPITGAAVGLQFAWRKSLGLIPTPQIVQAVPFLQLAYTVSQDNIATSAPPQPAPPQVGNLVLILGSSNISSYTAPLVLAAGWNELVTNIDPQTGAHRCAPGTIGFWKIWQAGDTMPEVVTASFAQVYTAFAYTLYEISGIDPINPIASVDPMADSNAAPFVSHVAGVVTNPGSLVLATAVIWDRSNGTGANLGSVAVTEPGWISDSGSSGNYHQNAITQFSFHKTFDQTGPLTFTATFDPTFGTALSLASYANPSTHSATMVVINPVVVAENPTIFEALLPLKASGLRKFPDEVQTFGYGFGKVTHGVFVDFGIAFAGADGRPGTINWFLINYTPGTMKIPSHYMLNGVDFTPIGSQGIPKGTGSPTDGVPPNNAASANAIPFVQATGSPNGTQTAYHLSFQFMNQPTDGSLSRIGVGFRHYQSGKAYAQYGDFGAIGADAQLKDKPLVGNYQVTLEDLSNFPGDWEFGFYAEDVQGNQTDYTDLGHYTSPIVASPTQLAQGVNLVPDSDFQAATMVPGGADYKGATVASSDPHWICTGLDGGASVIVGVGPGGDCPAAAIIAVARQASGHTAKAISSAFNSIPGQIYTESMYYDVRRCSGGASGGAYIELLDCTADPTNVANGIPIAGTRVHGSPGTNGRANGTWTCPADGSITVIAAVISTDGMSIGTSGYCYIGAPMVQYGASMTGYKPGAPTPGPLKSSAVVLSNGGADAPTTTIQTAPGSTAVQAKAASISVGSIVFNSQPTSANDVVFAAIPNPAAPAGPPLLVPIGGGGSPGVSVIDYRPILDEAYGEIGDEIGQAILSTDHILLRS